MRFYTDWLKGLIFSGLIFFDSIIGFSLERLESLRLFKAFISLLLFLKTR